MDSVFSIYIGKYYQSFPDRVSILH